MASKKDFEVFNYLIQKIVSKYSNLSSGTLSLPLNLQEIQEDFLHSAKAIKVLLHENKKLHRYLDQLLEVENKNNELSRHNEVLFQENRQLLKKMNSFNACSNNNSNRNSNSNMQVQEQQHINLRQSANEDEAEEEEKNEMNDKPLSLGASLLIESMNYKHYITEITKQFGDDYMLKLVNKETNHKYLEAFRVYLNKLKDKDQIECINNTNSNGSKTHQQHKHKSTLSSPHYYNSPKLPLRISKKFSSI